MILLQLRPPDEVISNYEIIKAWAIDIGIAVAVLVGVGTLIGMAWTTYKKRRARRE